MNVEKLIERLHATAKNLRAIGELPPEMSVFFGPNLPEEAATALAKLQAERDEANQRALANNVLSHGWMVAHDCLMAGLPYTYPSPADVPNIIRERDEAREALRPFAEANCRIVGISSSADDPLVGYAAWTEKALSLAHFRAASRALGGGE